MADIDQKLVVESRHLNQITDVNLQSSEHSYRQTQTIFIFFCGEGKRNCLEIGSNDFLYTLCIIGYTLNLIIEKLSQRN